MQREINQEETITRQDAFWKVIANDITLWIQACSNPKILPYSPNYTQTILTYNFLEGESVQLIEGKNYLHFFVQEHGVHYSKHIKKEELEQKTESEAIYFIIKYLSDEVWSLCKMKTLSSYLRIKDSEFICQECGKTHFAAVFELDNGRAIECPHCGFNGSFPF